MDAIIDLLLRHLALVQAAILGFVEGLTEFLPVSSTGHLLLLQHFFGWSEDDFGKTFAILIQLGAILALLTIYFGRLLRIAATMFTSWQTARFVIGILLAFLPAAAIGVVAHGFIKAVLFNVWIVCTMLIVGGLILLWVDRKNLQPRYLDATDMPLLVYLGIGIIQCFAMIPGTSRSGSTIVGAMLLGADRRAAADFSFWLAIPTMTGAFAYELYKSHAQLSADNTALIAVGFAMSFVTGWFVVKGFLKYVQRHSLALFAWWRIIVGTLGLIALALGH